jgi:hypothetical protein
MAYLILQLAGLLLAFCGLAALSFILALYISIKRLGGSLERRHLLVITGVAFFLFLGAIVLSIVGATA